MTHVKMAMRTDNIMTLVNISSAIANAGANDQRVFSRGMCSVLLLMAYVLDELHRYRLDSVSPISAFTIHRYVIAIYYVQKNLQISLTENRSIQYGV